MVILNVSYKGKLEFCMNINKYLLLYVYALNCVCLGV